MSEPSKGPWRTIVHLAKRPEDIDYELHGAGGEEIGIIWGEDNARLVEKAPEMLALLREIADTIAPSEDYYRFVPRVDGLIAYIVGDPTHEED